MGKISKGLFSFIFVGAFWESLSRLGLLNEIILPAPSKILLTFFNQIAHGDLINNLAVSLMRVGLGFALASAVALPLGYALGLNLKTRQFIFPLVNFLRPIPPIAWTPLAILWFGIGHGPAVFLTMIAAVFTILFNTILGVDRISKEHLNVARCFQASRRLTFKEVILPASKPTVLAGLRVGFGLSWMTVVGAEMIASTSGLGHLISAAQDSLQIDLVIVGMLTIGMTAFICDVAFRKLANYA